MLIASLRGSADPGTADGGRESLFEEVALVIGDRAGEEAQFAADVFEKSTARAAA